MLTTSATIAEWNREFEEERMRWVDTQPATAPSSVTSYRKFTEGLVVSNSTPPVILALTEDEMMEGKFKKGSDVTSAFLENELTAIQLEAFPTMEEKL